MLFRIADYVFQVQRTYFNDQWLNTRKCFFCQKLQLNSKVNVCGHSYACFDCMKDKNPLFCRVCFHLVDVFSEIVIKPQALEPKPKNPKFFLEIVRKSQALEPEPKDPKKDPIDEEKPKKLSNEIVKILNNENKEENNLDKNFTIEKKIQPESFDYKPLKDLLYLEELGDGNFGKVFKAFDLKKKQLIALKIIKRKIINPMLLSFLRRWNC